MYSDIFILKWWKSRTVWSVGIYYRINDRVNLKHYYLSVYFIASRIHAVVMLSTAGLWITCMQATSALEYVSD